MKLLLFFSLFALTQASQAAVSLLIEATPSGLAKWTITQTSPAPELGIAGLSGYAMGMSLPPAMFAFTYLDGEGPITPIDVSLGGSLAGVHEIYGNSSFQLSSLHLSYSSGSGPIYLPFSSLWTVGGQTSARFDLTPAPPLTTNLDINLFQPGVHTIQDTLFGTVTVTVIPEPSAAALLSGPLALGLLHRRRRRSS